MRNKRIVTVSFNKDNDLLENLRKYAPKDAKVLFITGNSDQPEYTDSCLQNYKKSFELSNLSYSSFDLCDFRNKDKDILNYNFLILGSGSTDAQIKFYNEINLKEKLQKFQGLIVTLEGSTNSCSDAVYEDPNVCEIDPYVRIADGLGITKLNIMAKLSYSEEDFFTKAKNITDVKKFYLLKEKSYIIQKGNDITLYGEAYLAEDNKIKKISNYGETLSIK